MKITTHTTRTKPAPELVSGDRLVIEGRDGHRRAFLVVGSPRTFQGSRYTYVDVAYDGDETVGIRIRRGEDVEVLD